MISIISVTEIRFFCLFLSLKQACCVGPSYFWLLGLWGDMVPQRSLGMMVTIRCLDAGNGGVISTGFRIRQTWVSILTLPHTNRATLGKLCDCGQVT